MLQKNHSRFFIPPIFYQKFKKSALLFILLSIFSIFAKASNDSSYCTMYSSSEFDFLTKNETLKSNSSSNSMGIFCRQLVGNLTGHMLNTTLTTRFNYNINEVQWIKIIESHLVTQDLGEFSIYPKLLTIFLSENNLSYVFGKLPSTIRRLNLSSNQITHLSDTLFSLSSHLEVIDLSSNRLHELSDSFWNLKFLRHFNAYGNEFTCQWVIAKFWEFWVEHGANILDKADDTLCFTEEAMINTYTFLGALKAKSHKEEECNKSRVKELGCNCTLNALHYNYPKAYPTSHEGRRGRLSISLKVDCQSLDLTSLPQIPPLTAELNMSHNRLTDLTLIRTSPNYKNLKVLDASYNQIKSLDGLDNSSFIGQIQLLNLKHNAFSELPRRILSMIANTDGRGTTCLSKNFIRCDCNAIRESRPILINHKKEKFQDIEEIYCANLEKVKLLELLMEEVCISESSVDHEFWWFIAISFEATLIILIIIKLWYDSKLYRQSGTLPFFSRIIPRLPFDFMWESLRSSQNSPTSRKESVVSHHFSLKSQSQSQSAININSLSTNLVNTRSSITPTIEPSTSSKRGSFNTIQDEETQSFLVKFANFHKKT